MMAVNVEIADQPAEGRTHSSDITGDTMVEVSINVVPKRGWVEMEKLYSGVQEKPHAVVQLMLLFLQVIW